jgi:hypothetical protein
VPFSDNLVCNRQNHHCTNILLWHIYCKLTELKAGNKIFWGKWFFAAVTPKGLKALLGFSPLCSTMDTLSESVNFCKPTLDWRFLNDDFRRRWSPDQRLNYECLLCPRRVTRSNEGACAGLCGQVTQSPALLKQYCGWLCEDEVPQPPGLRRRCPLSTTLILKV